MHYSRPTRLAWLNYVLQWIDDKLGHPIYAWCKFNSADFWRWVEVPNKEGKE